jgi:hypothetical protein
MQANTDFRRSEKKKSFLVRFMSALSRFNKHGSPGKTDFGVSHVSCVISLPEQGVCFS